MFYRLCPGFVSFMRLHNREICGNRLNRAPSIPVGVRPSWFRWIVFVDDLDQGEEDVEVELVLFCLRLF